jgi:hypothetical protein
MFNIGDLADGLFSGPEAEAARAQRGEWEDFFSAVSPQLEQQAHKRHDAEAKIGARLERDQADYDAALDAELDREEALLAEQDREKAEEEAETDPRKIWARKQKRQEEEEEIKKLILKGKAEKIPSFYAIYRQDLAARREQRAQKAHEAAEAKAGIPRAQKKWTDRRDAIEAGAEKALTGERERHFHAERAILAKQDDQHRENGEYPTLPKPPIRVPNIRLADHQEAAKPRERLDASARELQKARAIGAPSPEGAKTVHPEIAAARKKARWLGRKGRS